MIISPCISICKTTHQQAIVMVVEEVMKKKDFGNWETTDDWKKKI